MAEPRCAPIYFLPIARGYTGGTTTSGVVIPDPESNLLFPDDDLFPDTDLYPGEQ